MMLQKNQLHVIYSGPLSSNSVESIAQILKQRMILDNLSLSSSQAIFSVFVEQVNNMLTYSSNHKSTAPKSLLVMGTRGKTYFLQSGNLVNSNNVDIIRDYIDYLNSLDKPELRAYYKETLKKENPESKNSQLGFIEIAKRVNSKIQYYFTPAKDNLSFFSMYVEII